MKTYKAIATLTDGGTERDVVIYSAYQSIEEALEGLRRFAAHGYNIVKIRVEESIVGCGVCKHGDKLLRYEPCKSCERYSNFELREGLT